MSEVKVEIRVLSLNRRLLKQIPRVERWETVEKVNVLGWVKGELLDPEELTWDYLLVESDDQYRLLRFLKFANLKKLVPGREVKQIYIY